MSAKQPMEPNGSDITEKQEYGKVNLLLLFLLCGLIAYIICNQWLLPSIYYTLASFKQPAEKANFVLGLISIGLAGLTLIVAVIAAILAIFAIPERTRAKILPVVKLLPMVGMSSKPHFEYIIVYMDDSSDHDQNVKHFAEEIHEELKRRDDRANLIHWVESNDYIRMIDQIKKQGNYIVTILSPAFVARLSSQRKWKRRFRKLNHPSSGHAALILKQWDEGIRQRFDLQAISHIVFDGLDETSIRNGVALLPLRSGNVLPANTSKQLLLNNAPPSSPLFQGRKDELKRIYDTFCAPRRSSHVLIQAIIGLSGMGTTQVAARFVEEAVSRRRYEVVLWIHALGKDMVTICKEVLELLNEVNESRKGKVEAKDAQIERIAKIISKARPSNDANVLISAVRNVIKEHNRWLLVLDECKWPVAIRQLITSFSQGDSGDILLTTDMSKIGNNHRIKRFEQIYGLKAEEGAQFLEERTDLHARMSSLTADELEEERSKAKQISKEMGGLPFGLEIAGAYITKQQSTFQELLDGFQQDVNVFSGFEEGEFPYKKSIATIWKFAYEDLRRSRMEYEKTKMGDGQFGNVAVQLLGLCSFLDYDPIPKIRITTSPEIKSFLAGNDADLQQRTVDELVHAALGELGNYSLMTSNGRDLIINPLLKRVVRAGWLSFDADQIAVVAENHKSQSTLAAFISSISRLGRSSATSVMSEGYCRQADEIVTEVKPWTWMKRAIQAVYILAMSRIRQSSIPMSKSGGRVSVYQAQSSHPAAQPRSSHSIPNDGALQGHSADEVIKSWVEQAIRIVHAVQAIKTECGKMHLTDWKKCRNDIEGVKMCANYAMKLELKSEEAHDLLYLASRYHFERAEYKKTKHYLKQLLDQVDIFPGRPTTRHKYYNLMAEVYREQGKYEEAETMYSEALKLCQEETTDWAVVLNNLGRLYVAQADMAVPAIKENEAEANYKKVLMFYIKNWPLTDDQQVANFMHTLRNITWLYFQQGKFDKVDELYKEDATKEGARKVFRAFLGLRYYMRNERGQYRDFERIFKVIVEVGEKKLGSDNFATALSCGDLAVFYETRQNAVKAKEYFRKAVKSGEDSVGRDHPQVKIWNERLQRYLAIPNKVQGNAGSRRE